MSLTRRVEDSGLSNRRQQPQYRIQEVNRDDRLLRAAEHPFAGEANSRRAVKKSRAIQKFRCDWLYAAKVKQAGAATGNPLAVPNQHLTKLRKISWLSSQDRSATVGKRVPV